ncbi:putative sarcoplasmic reticulum glycoprotein putativesarcalumenin precursor [Leptomonas pyrrhocoris]|uniref:Sarcalumenin n=1 Tax=Leptomonas pyrrhocoris TaxID=157538 RepID=A0A0M9G578_LEPPY|nr:putative sarcoplasmic reticulum glycoprotein putativesarcalumenin precursor [Leptomonas pyrrhocoris]KPA82640.1 putative sarcoplasmic reticulum glycoprotein putativesarcalumenin precursor [Leptomonas pyrrhocoris]|eukprot:XP_015661079.1 putative sarcoplasmic reticulum glycoprotein putativesarcalumenin precursor [Leptomonas pyrrhocoris]
MAANATQPTAGPPRLRGTESGGDVPGSMEVLIKKLHPLYTERVQPLEAMYKFDVFRPSWYEETILNQRPFVTLFGPWSAGKTTFINYLLQNNYLWTGPQPTTAEFTVVMYGKEAGPIDGQALANSKELPFKGLLEFGESFVGNLKGFQAPHPLLERVTLIDTPGVLESTQEIHKRKYDYVKVCRWFAERSDLMFVLFDPSKLDAGAELRQLFKTSFKGLESRVRIVLNKADSISTQELMRVYGSLFWNLSNFIDTTEPPRVYVGSFWDQPYNPESFRLLFAEEKVDLLQELLEVIPQQAKDKKVASLIRRAKEVLVHVLIIGGIRQDLPALFFKAKAKKKALAELPKRYELIGSRYKMNHRDFPPVEAYRTFLERFDVEKFPELQKVEKSGHIKRIQELIDTILPSMLRPVGNTTAANPFDAEERSALLAVYKDSIRSQYSGAAGIQGSTDIVASTVRKGVAEASSSPLCPPPPSSPSPAAADASAEQQQMWRQMMGMMQQMMQSSAPPASGGQQGGGSALPATVMARPAQPAPPMPAAGESSAPPTPYAFESDNENDGGPPTVAPATMVPPSQQSAGVPSPVRNTWISADCSKPLQ